MNMQCWWRRYWGFSPMWRSSTCWCVHRTLPPLSSVSCVDRLLGKLSALNLSCLDWFPGLVQVLGKDLFNTLREKHGLAGFQKLFKEKIVPLAGDIGDRNFGLNSSRADALAIELTCVEHAPASLLCSFMCGPNSSISWNGSRSTKITEKIVQGLVYEHTYVSRAELRSEFWRRTALNLSLQQPGEHHCISWNIFTRCPFSHDRLIYLAYIHDVSLKDIAS